MGDNMKTSKSIVAFIIIIMVCSINHGIVYSATGSTSIPSTPTNFKAVSAGYDRIKLTWNAVKGASGYQVSRATSNTGIYTWINTTTYPAYTNTGLVTGKVYYYKVRAYKYIGTKKIYGGYSIVDSAKPLPLVPTNFKAVFASENTAKLSWKSVSGASGYQICRATSKTGTYTAIKNTAATSYSNAGLTSGKTYYYKVRAYRCVGTTKIYGKFSVIIPVNTAKVVGYYAAWAAYSRFTPDMVDVSKLTHINYAFASIGSDLKIAVGYPDVDISNFNKLKELKKSYPNLKTIISVGGWSWSERFSDVALTDASRTVFANSCVNFIVQNGFDGVDIDWEYPVGGGMSTNKNRPEDKTNFTLLMQKLREKLDARGVIDGKHYILTFAGASSYNYLNNTEISKLCKYVDYANIMTYDIHGTWDSYTDYNAPLYPNTDTSPQYKWSVDQSINAWLKAGFPKDKMVMGVPFYGYVYNAVADINDGLYQRYSGGASISYETIANYYLKNPAYSRYFHAGSMVPWLFNGSTFISYDDEQSIGLKAGYIKSKGLGGGMIWELSQDPNGVLLRSLYNGLK